MAEIENPLYAFIVEREAEQNETLIREYAKCGPTQLLAHCERMILCLAGFDTVFLLSPSTASHQLGLIDDEWLNGFDRASELLCVAAMERKIEVSAFRSLASAARAFWTRLAEPETTRNDLTALYQPGMAALNDLKRALMVESARTLPTTLNCDESLIERLSAGPDDVELSPREMALLEAHLRQPVSFATIPQEKKATGHSPTKAARNKLKLIRDFNRRLQGQGDANRLEKPSDPVPAVGLAEATTAAATGSNASLALMRVFTNGIADDRIEKATRLLADDKLTVNEKLTKIDALIPFPATASAEQLGEMLGVTKQAVLKTDWWIQNRKGEKESEVGRRRDGHRKRAKSYEAPSQDGDEE